MCFNVVHTCVKKEITSGDYEFGVSFFVLNRSRKIFTPMQDCECDK